MSTGPQNRTERAARLILRGITVTSIARFRKLFLVLESLSWRKVVENVKIKINPITENGH